MTEQQAQIDVIDRSPIIKPIKNAINSFFDETKGVNQFDQQENVFHLDGEFGSGKSFVINQTADHYKNAGSGVTFINFQAWNYKDEEELVIQIFNDIAHINREDKEFITRLGFSFMRLITSESGLKAIGTTMALFGVPIPPQIFKFSIDIVKETAKKGVNFINRMLSNEKVEEEVVKKLSDSLEGIEEKHGKKIVLVLDDLDRAEESKIWRIFMLLNVFKNYNNLLFMIVGDREYFYNVIDKRYHGKEVGFNFMDKFVTQSFSMPRIKTVDVLKDAITQYHPDIDLSNKYDFFDKLRVIIPKITKSGKPAIGKFYTIESLNIREIIKIVSKNNTEDSIYKSVLIELIKLINKSVTSTASEYGKVKDSGSMYEVKMKDNTSFHYYFYEAPYSASKHSYVGNTIVELLK